MHLYISHVNSFLLNRWLWSITIHHKRPWMSHMLFLVAKQGLICHEGSYAPGPGVLYRKPNEKKVNLRQLVWYLHRCKFLRFKYMVIESNGDFANSMYYIREKISFPLLPGDCNCESRWCHSPTAIHSWKSKKFKIACVSKEWCYSLLYHSDQ